MMNKQIISLLLLVFLLSIPLTGCGDDEEAGMTIVQNGSESTEDAEGGAENGDGTGADGQNGADYNPDGLPLNIQPSVASQIKLKDYTSQAFTMKIPAGWKVETTGQCQSPAT